MTQTEYDEFSSGLSPDEYKQAELKKLEAYENESDTELERKRLVVLSLMLLAVQQGNPHGLVEFNKNRYEILSAIVRKRERSKGIMAKISMGISLLALAVAIFALFK